MAAHQFFSGDSHQRQRDNAVKHKHNCRRTQQSTVPIQPHPLPVPPAQRDALPFADQHGKRIEQHGKQRQPQKSHGQAERQIGRTFLNLHRFGSYTRFASATALPIYSAGVKSSSVCFASSGIAKPLIN